MKKKIIKNHPAHHAKNYHTAKLKKHIGKWRVMWFSIGIIVAVFAIVGVSYWNTTINHHVLGTSLGNTLTVTKNQLACHSRKLFIDLSWKTNNYTAAAYHRNYNFQLNLYSYVTGKTTKLGTYSYKPSNTKQTGFSYSVPLPSLNSDKTTALINLRDIGGGSKFPGIALDAKGDQFGYVKGDFIIYTSQNITKCYTNGNYR